MSTVRRTLIALLAANLLATPAFARVEPDEAVGVYLLEGAGCPGVIDDNRFEIVAASESSLRFIAGGETLNADSFDASSGHFSMASGDGYLVIDGRLERETNAVTLDLDLSSPPLGLDCHMVASKAADPAEVQAEATTDAALAAGAAVEAPPVEPPEPSDAEVRSALHWDDTTLLIAAFVIFLIGAAVASSRREARAAPRRDRNRKLAECARLAKAISKKEEELTSFRMHNVPEEFLKKVTDDIEKWQKMRARLVDAGWYKAENIFKDLKLNLYSDALEGLRKNPIEEADRQLEINRQRLATAKGQIDQRSRLETEIAALRQQRATLGCEALEKFTQQGEGYVSSMGEPTGKASSPFMDSMLGDDDRN